MLKQHHSNSPANDMAGRQKRLVATLDHHAATTVANRLPTSAISRSLLQADAVLAVLARSTTLPGFVHWQDQTTWHHDEAASPRSHLRRSTADQCLSRIGSVEHDNESSLASQCPKRPHDLPAKIQGEFMFGAKFPVISLFQLCRCRPCERTTATTAARR